MRVVYGTGIKGGWGLKALTGGIGPTVPLWSLKLALAYHSSAMGLACAHIARLGRVGLLRVSSSLLSPPDGLHARRRATAAVITMHCVFVR